MAVEKIDDNWHYIRHHSIESESLAYELESLMNDCKCAIVSSGMCALSVVFEVLMKDQVDVIIRANELYSDSPTTIQFLSKRYPQIKHELIDISSSGANSYQFDDRKYKNKNIILFAESFSNPNMYMFDYDQIDTLRKNCKKLHVVIDNTFMPCFTNPLDAGADIVITSLTKHHAKSKHIAGAIFSRQNSIHKKITQYLIRYGIHTAPHTCSEIRNTMKDIEARLERCHKNAVEVAKHIQTLVNAENSLIARAMHLSLESHPHFERAKSIKVAPSFVTMIINAPIECVRNILKNSEIEYKTSYGSDESRFCSYPTRISNTQTQCRLYIGGRLDRGARSAPSPQTPSTKPPPAVREVDRVINEVSRLFEISLTKNKV